jgi:electron transfer flavoprotein alpha/beta subunit
MTPANFEPKLPGVREIMAARRKSTITWDMSALGGSRE